MVAVVLVISQSLTLGSLKATDYDTEKEDNR